MPPVFLFLWVPPLSEEKPGTRQVQLSSGYLGSRVARRFSTPTVTVLERLQRPAGNAWSPEGNGRLNLVGVDIDRAVAL